MTRPSGFGTVRLMHHTNLSAYEAALRDSASAQQRAEALQPRLRQRHHRILSERDAQQMRELWRLRMLHTETRYLAEFLGRRSCIDLIELGAFPQKDMVKEVSEASALRQAAVDYLGCDPSDPGILAVCPGDGSTPRLGALLAYTTRWTIVSVDPALSRWVERWPGGARTSSGPVERLRVIPRTAEEAAREVALDGRRAVVLACHSHADLAASVAVVDAPSDSIAVAALPCCVPQRMEGRPSFDYCDDAVLSPHRIVRVFPTLAGG